MATVNPAILSDLSTAQNLDTKIINSFFDGSIPLIKSDYVDDIAYRSAMNQLISVLTSKSIDDIIFNLPSNYKIPEISTGEIPQFSDLSMAMYNTPELFREKNLHEISYRDLGELLWDSERSDGANLKYGENHAKTAAQIGLVTIDRNKRISLSDFGDIFLSLDDVTKALLIPRLWLREPLFRDYFSNGKKKDSIKQAISILKESTQKRRLSNISTIIEIIENGSFFRENKLPANPTFPTVDLAITSTTENNDHLRALHTKPFLLLAGISGTGKSRIVKKMAFDSCPDIDDLRKDATSPGNYCLIEVKPNWHDSTELLGYESRINGAEYIFTPFIKFLVKAMKYPDIPFFVCLDEMNLAPVEQYFAEFLSVLESRTKKFDNEKGEWHIVSECLIDKSIFSSKEYGSDFEEKIKKELIGKDGTLKVEGTGPVIYEPDLTPQGKLIFEELKKFGLRIPENVLFVGTVNMDETTHQFSRKVIDRAMTIEMNLPKGNPFLNFYSTNSELEYKDTPNNKNLYLPQETSAAKVIEILEQYDEVETDNLKEDVAKFLTDLNNSLEGTPFKVAFRVQNEMILFFYQLWNEKGRPASNWEELKKITFDNILMMKVLPRIEGDDILLKSALDRKSGKLVELVKDLEKSSEKIHEMTLRLENTGFTSFWP